MLKRLKAMFASPAKAGKEKAPELRGPTLEGMQPPGDGSGAPDATENHGAVGLRDIIDSGWFNKENSEIYAGVTVKPEDVVLDVGCGDGGAIKFCASQGAHIIYLDVNSDKVAALESQLANSPASSVRGIVGTGESIEVPSASVDTVICTEVLEHVDDPERVVSEMHRVGKSGAMYLLTVPHASGEAVMKDTAPPQYFQKPNHVRIYDTDDFRQLVINSGLDIVQYEKIGAFWTLSLAILWSTGADFSNPQNPALANWSKTWSSILAHERGREIKAALNDAIPSKQFILARKP